MMVIKFLALASLAFFAALYFWAYKSWLKLKVFSLLLGWSPWWVRHTPKWVCSRYLAMLQLF